ncbi:hypothetical protein IWX90DRAFT_278597 [Phyllosticta citrichinensis]|uniref:18S rRNA factor 2 n=1 Tax=Phyllosticta citrichinensis TaxID=1130410 RepID=A0ABR1XNE3_9PEZI
MATRKRNEWLEANDASEDEEDGYNSEAEELAKGRAASGRASKRRKFDDSDYDSAEDEDDISADPSLQRKDAPAPKGKPRNKDAEEGAAKNAKGDDEPAADHDDFEEDEDEDGNATMRLESKKNLTQKQAEKAAKATKKSGVVYLSRIPPFMKPMTVKSLLSQYGTIGRVFLTPEDPTVYKRRKASGGNKKKSFVDGWVEFKNKKDAKAVVNLLNAKIIGGKKGGYYYDDVWNIKYLKGFKWNNLTEQIANENAERASKMRAEIAKTTRENKEFVQNVERAKMLQGMAEKKKKKEEKGEAQPQKARESQTKDREARRHFKQNEVRSKSAKNAPVEQSEDVKRVLSKIF